MKPLSDIDYVELYSERIKNDNTLFEQQKNIIESQLQGSSSLFKNMFGKNFKLNARKYLKRVGLLK
jgi:hypothetical protein